MGFNFDDLNKLKDSIQSSIDDGSIQDKVKKMAEDGVKKGVESINGGINSLNNYMNAAGDKKEQPSVCPHCNAPLNLDLNKDTVVCPYCNAEIDLRSNKTVTDKVFSFINQQQEKEEKRKEEERRQQAIEDAKPFYKKKTFPALAGMIAMFIVCSCALGIMTARASKKSAENEVKLEALLQEINQDISNGDLDAAEIKANMLKEDSGYSKDKEKKWDDTRNSVLDLIAEKKSAISKVEEEVVVESDTPKPTEDEAVDEPVAISKWDFAFVKKGSEYSSYYIFDSNSGEVVSFVTNDTGALKGTFEGNPEGEIVMTFTAGEDTWTEKFKNKTWYDHSGNAYDGFKESSVSEAEEFLAKTDY